MSIPRPVTTASVLFDARCTPAPPAPLTVFDLNPPARALLTECRTWGECDEPLTGYAETPFAALAAVTWRLAEQSSPVAVPAGRSPELRRALELTERWVGGGSAVGPASRMWQTKWASRRGRRRGASMRRPA